VLKGLDGERKPLGIAFLSNMASLTLFPEATKKDKSARPLVLRCYDPLTGGR
jgi:hypothetical protein